MYSGYRGRVPEYKTAGIDEGCPLWIPASHWSLRFVFSAPALIDENLKDSQNWRLTRSAPYGTGWGCWRTRHRDPRGGFHLVDRGVMFSGTAMMTCGSRWLPGLVEFSLLECRRIGMIIPSLQKWDKKSYGVSRDKNVYRSDHIERRFSSFTPMSVLVALS